MNSTAKTKAVFLDRDDTINKDFGYVYKVSDLVFLDGATEGIKLFNKKGYLVFVISNQSAVGRGYCSMESVENFNNEMIKQLADKGAIVSKIYICTHTPEDNCECRKPKTALFLQAVKEFNIDIAQSYAIGDKERDITGLIELGAKGAIVGKVSDKYPHFKNLKEVAQLFVK